MDKTRSQTFCPAGEATPPNLHPKLVPATGGTRESESLRGGRRWPLGRGQVPAVTRGFEAQPQFLKGPEKKTVEVKSKQPLVGRVGGH